MTQWQNIRWTVSNKYVDADTGEILTKEQVKQHYIKIKSTRYAQVNQTRPTGHVEYTIECRRNPQTKIEFNETNNE